MKYKQKKIKLVNMLSFLNHFRDKERFLFYNPLNNMFIMGAKRIKSFSFGDIPKDYMYAFSLLTFFENIKGNKWKDIGNESVVFEYLFIQKNNEQILYYINDDINIVDEDLKLCNHKYEIKYKDYKDWQNLFSRAKNSIIDREVEKVVISTEIEIVCDENPNIESIFYNLRKNNPNCFVFAYYKNDKIFLGATPEVLIHKKKDELLSYGLAGTIVRDKNNDELQKEKLMNDKKNLHEHQIVRDSIVNEFKKYANDVQVEASKVLSLKNFHHLYTQVYAKNLNNTIFDWVKLLHPTPALGGKPKVESLNLIKNFEPHERGLYGAPIGITDSNGDGVFVVGIRSALIIKNRIYAYAGCGIVENSNCKSEYRETKNKLKTIIESL